MSTDSISKTFQDGQAIIEQGRIGDCMYVIQSGKVRVTQERDGKEVLLAICGEGDLIGEMAIFEHETRSATVRAVGETRVLELNKQTFLRHVHEDPSLAYRMVQKMSSRIRESSAELASVKRTSHDAV